MILHLSKNKSLRSKVIFFAVYKKCPFGTEPKKYKNKKEIKVYYENLIFNSSS